MKRFVLSAFTGAFLVSAFAISAYAAEPNPVDFEMEDRVLQGDRILVENAVTEIKVKEGLVFRVETKPTSEQMIEGLKLIDKGDLSIYATQEERAQLRSMGIDVDPVDHVVPDPMADYEKLDAAGKRNFEEKRLLYLRMAAKSLYGSRMAIGAGMLVGDGFSYVFAKVRGKPVQTEKDPARREKMIQRVLTSLNYRLYSQAPLVVSSNEIGVILSVGVTAVSGARSIGTGGLVETGLLIGFNKADKIAIIENFIGPERFMKSLSVVAVAGINFKLGLYMANRDKDTKTANRKGVSFYPPVAPAFSSMGKSQFMMGLSSGFTVPPSPFADIMTFSSAHNQMVTVRIELSKAFKGFVRLSFGDYGSVVKPVFISIKEYAQQFKHGIAHLRGRTCQQVFVKL